MSRIRYTMSKRMKRQPITIPRLLAWFWDWTLVTEIPRATTMLYIEKYSP